MVTYLIIFGAAVRQDGAPSGSLLRRVEGALRISEDIPNCIFLATGRGRHKSAEGEVIAAELIARGVPPSRILVECQARDTLESALYCDKLLRKEAAGLVITCSSNYHNPRCAALLRILGHQVRIHKMPADLPHLGWLRLTLYIFKEFVALPYDMALLLSKQLRRSISLADK